MVNSNERSRFSYLCLSVLNYKMYIWQKNSCLISQTSICLLAGKLTRYSVSYLTQQQPTQIQHLLTTGLIKGLRTLLSCPRLVLNCTFPPTKLLHSQHIPQRFLLTAKERVPAKGQPQCPKKRKLCPWSDKGRRKKPYWTERELSVLSHY